MIPHPKSGQSLEDVFANRSEWMLLDRSRISFDGSECDKVGGWAGRCVGRKRTCCWCGGLLLLNCVAVCCCGVHVRNVIERSITLSHQHKHRSHLYHTPPLLIVVVDVQVGTSFTAFRYQAGACRRAPQVPNISQHCIYS